MTRREVVKAAAIGAVTVTLRGNDVAAVKACVFDTFGTVVDWRGSIIAEGEGLGKN